jgi:hypothetical protein
MTPRKFRLFLRRNSAARKKAANAGGVGFRFGTRKLPTSHPPTRYRARYNHAHNKMRRGCAMEICYESTLALVVGWLVSSDGAAWVGALGSLAAIWAAFWLYRRTRLDAKADLLARRRVLHAMLREQVIKAANFVPDALEKMRNLKGPLDPVMFRLHMLTTNLPHAERLIELQRDLLEFGEVGDDAIAAFIEASRDYRAAHRTWSEYLAGSGAERTYPAEDVELVAGMFEKSLERLSITAAPALAAIEQFDKR